jgi:hypothetical protein
MTRGYFSCKARYLPAFGAPALTMTLLSAQTSSSVKAYLLPMGGLLDFKHSGRALRMLSCGGLLAIAIAGCASTQSSSEQVRGTLLRFTSSVAHKDYHTLCTQLLAPNLTERLEQIGLPCEQALAKGLGSAHNPALTVRSVQVQGESASAVVDTTASNQPPSHDTIKLTRLNGKWRIASLGSASS